MKRYLLATIALLFIALRLCFSQTKGENALQQWQAGKKVALSDVRKFGEKKCFAAEPISNKVFSRMWKKSYKADCTVPRSQLRYVKTLHYNLKGELCIGEMVCNKAIANDLVDIFRKLYNAKYPIERMVLIDDYDADDEKSMTANNSSCFNYRRATNSKTLSLHSLGRAVDINTLYNPYVKRLKNGKLSVEPAKGRLYINRSKKFDYKIDHNDLVYKLFKQHGFVWGGDWKSVKDYQHFEKRH